MNLCSLFFDIIIIFSDNTTYYCKKISIFAIQLMK